MGYWFAIFFINVDFYSYINFSLNTPFPAFHKFWYILFLFLLFSKYVVISPMISSLTHRLFKSMFNLPIFLNLLHFLLLKLISNVIPFREENYCDFYFLKIYWVIVLSWQILLLYSVVKWHLLCMFVVAVVQVVCLAIF